MITASVVSHGHGDMARRLVERLLECPEISKIVVTLNIPENLALPENNRVEVVRNPEPLGYGANHNQAFRLSAGDFFCVLNPDIALLENPFGQLLNNQREIGADLSAPRVLSPQGEPEDSVRRFPTPMSLLAKALRFSDRRIHFGAASAPFCPDWFAGMFMLFRRDAYARLGGFDEQFFMYYEDVDICARAWKLGMKIVVCPSAFVTHDARRDSHRSPRHLSWHLASMARYFRKHLGRLPKIDPQSGCQRVRQAI